MEEEEDDEGRGSSDDEEEEGGEEEESDNSSGSSGSEFDNASLSCKGEYPFHGSIQTWPNLGGCEFLVVTTW